jgi:beta-galactosidase
MLYMLKPGVADTVKAFVKGGGTLVLTYLSGIVDRTNLTLLGGWPGGGLRELAGVWVEEIDSLYPASTQRIVPSAGNGLGLAGEHPIRDYCDRLHAESAQVLATYKNDFYAGTPCLTVNRYGSGRVYYLATRPDKDSFHDAFTTALVGEMKIARCLDVDLPDGVTVQKRVGGGKTFLFLHNFNAKEQRLELGARKLRNVVDGQTLTGAVTLPAYASYVLSPA